MDGRKYFGIDCRRQRDNKRDRRTEKRWKREWDTAQTLRDSLKMLKGGRALRLGRAKHQDPLTWVTGRLVTDFQLRISVNAIVASPTNRNVPAKKVVSRYLNRHDPPF